MKKKGYSETKLNKMHKNGYYNYLCSKEFEPVYEFIAENFLNESCKSILDVGCWNGMFYKVLKEKKYNDFYLGFDLSSSAIQEGKKLYGNKNTKFIVESWDNFKSNSNYEGIYFGGVFYYIEDKVNFIKRFINEVNPKIIIIQDLQSTDFSDVDKFFENVQTKNFKLNLNINEARRLRQVKIIKL